MIGIIVCSCSHAGSVQDCSSQWIPHNERNLVSNSLGKSKKVDEDLIRLRWESCSRLLVVLDIASLPETKCQEHTHIRCLTSESFAGSPPA